MLGHNHVTMSMGAGVLTLPLVPSHHAAVQAGWVVACGGLGLLPDLDKRGTTAARTWGPLTTWLAQGVGTIARGHRKGTHDAVLAPLAFAGTAALALHSHWATIVVVALAIGLALQGLGLRGLATVGPPVNLVVSVGAAWWLVDTGHTRAFEFLPLATAVGVLAHLAGDALTTDRLPIPLLWLTGTRRRVGLGLFRTGATVENAVVTPLLTVALLALVVWHVGVQALPFVPQEVKDAVTSAVRR